MQMGIWHFACQSHVDVKRISTRMGLSIHDNSACDALNSLTDERMQFLKTLIAESMQTGQVLYTTVLDNVQQYAQVFEHGIGRENQLRQGTFATVIHLEDIEPGAFDLKPQL